MKEKEIDTLAIPWASARVAHLLPVWRDAATVEDDQATEESSPDEYDEVVVTKNMETVDAFSSCVIPMKAEKAYIGEGINIMTQSLWTEDGFLPQGLTMQNAYTKLRKGSKNAVMVVRNKYGLPPNSRRKSQWQSSGCYCSAGTVNGDQVARGGRWASRPSHTQVDC